MSTKRPGIGSALVRIALSLLSIAMVASMGEVFDAWGKPDGYYTPSAGNMPHWGLYPLWVMLVATPLLLAAGWWQRRHGGTRRGVSRACVIIGAMQIAWTILLLWSFVAGQAQISGQAMPADGGQFFELLLAAAAALAALILVRDSRQRRTGELIVAESKSPMEDTPDDTSAGEL